MSPNLNDNPCVCCGEYAVEGSLLCWQCKQGMTNTKTAQNCFDEKFSIKALDKKNKV